MRARRDGLRGVSRVELSPVGTRVLAHMLVQVCVLCGSKHSITVNKGVSIMAKDKAPRMTVGHLRKVLEGVPDDMKVFLEQGTPGSGKVREGHIYVTDKRAYKESDDDLPRLTQYDENSILVIDLKY